RPLPGVPGLRVGLPLRRAVRPDHRLLQEGHGPARDARPAAQLLATLDALQADALRRAHALGAGALAPAPAARAARGVRAPRAAAAPGGAARASSRRAGASRRPAAPPSARSPTAA